MNPTAVIIKPTIPTIPTAEVAEKPQVTGPSCTIM